MTKNKNGLEQGSSGATETTPLVAKNGDEGTSGGEYATGGKGGYLGGLLSAKQAALLVAGEMAGSGVLALPRALVRTGWLGVPVLIVMGAAAAFSGARLSDCWSLVETRDPEMRARQRNPYAIIADKALGKTWSAVVSMAVLFSLFGAACVYLLLASQLLQTVLSTLLPAVTFCAWFLIVVAVMSPLLLFGTPKDFSYLGVIAFGGTLVACVLYFIQMLNDGALRPFVYRYGLHGFQEFFLALGTIMFAFGGASAFPTIQNDMADRSKFGKSINFSFLAVLALYLLIGVTGYTVYGEAAGNNIATSLGATALTLVGNILMSIALLAAFVILINPVCQEMEELYKVPRDSLGWRMGIRLSIMVAILFIGESIPRFYTILALVGGTSVALLTYVLPPYCYLKLTQAADGQAPADQPDWMRLVCWQILIFGAIGGVLAAFSAISAIFSTAMVTPCYLR